MKAKVLTEPKSEPIYAVSINNAFRRVPFLAGVPPLAEWLRSNLRHAYGEKYDQVYRAYQDLIEATKNTPAAKPPDYNTTQFKTEADYKRDGRIYNISLNYANGWLSPAEIGRPWLTWAEALMLRSGMTQGVFVPEEQDFSYAGRISGAAVHARCEAMQDWCELAHNHVEMALEYTLYLHLIKQRLRLKRKWSSNNLLAKINPEWGERNRYGAVNEVTDRQWTNATSTATNRAIRKMLDDMTVIERGEKELPFLQVSAQMTTVNEDDAVHDYVHVQ